MTTRNPGRNAPGGCVLAREDLGPCSGAAEVEITDPTGQAAWGCVRHAALAWRSIVGARFTAATRPGALIEAMRLARRLS